MLNAKIIGNRIGDARKKMNLSQAQLAEHLFISSQAVGKWERGESLPDIIMLNRLAEIVGVDLNYFSENVQQATTETTSVESSGSTELSPDSSEKQHAFAGKTEKNPSWDMSRGNWVDADFSGLKNLNEKFSSSNMQRCKFIGSDLSGLLLSGNNIGECDFSGSEIRNSHIRRSNLEKNGFKDCSLNGTEFSGSNISKCDFTDSDFTGAKIKTGGFDNNTVSNALWNGTSFVGAYLLDIVFDGTLENCYFENCTFKRVTFEHAILVNTFFKNNNLKKIKFVDCKADRITYEFLKHGKADLNGITLLDV
ncbi:pentapeptide repeat-containing protein [Fluviicola taffensis]|uniref:pentapeptide repeat-containing protein n=1 Tax=Fluviicola taffensis TaxID=191579 RepID=UPI00313809B9